MKKLLFLLFAVVLFVGCSPMVNHGWDVENIPTEVYQELRKDTIPQKVYVYESGEYAYTFNEKKELKLKYYTGSGLKHGEGDVFTVMWFSILIALILGVVLGKVIWDD